MKNNSAGRLNNSFDDILKSSSSGNLQPKEKYIYSLKKIRLLEGAYKKKSKEKKNKIDLGSAGKNRFGMF